jgi:TetR/AcrR family transcriptional regulator, transcriptional repressor for nem operon
MKMKYNKEQIIMEGIKHMQLTGYHNTGIQDILQASNLPKGSFYNFFSSKEDYALHAIKLYSKHIMDFLDQIDGNNILTPLQKIQTFFEFIGQENKRGEHKYSCLLGNLALELAGTSEIFASSIDAEIKAWKNKTEKWVVQAQANVQITSELKPQEINDFIFDTFYGAILRAKYEKSSASFEQFLKLSFKLLQYYKPETF